MDDFIGGNSYKQTESQLKAKKWMKIIGIILFLLLVLCIALVGAIYYIQLTELKISMDGKSNTALKDILIIQNGKVYVPIRAFAQTVGYQSSNGGYKQYTEDATKCYVESQNEVATFSLDSNKIYKVVLEDGNNDNEYYEIDEPVVMINDQLCTTIEGAKIAFNISMSYDQNNNSITIYTLPYLVTYYTSKFQNAGIAENNASFSNQKALLYNMIIVKNEENHYGVYNLNGKEILGIKYSKIKFIESTQEFIVTTVEGKMGIMLHDSTTKISPEYDDIKQIDKDSGLYLVKNNNKQGVVNSVGSIVIFLEYDQVGIDITKYGDDVENQYLLYNKCIPVKQNNKWGLFDKTGRKITEVKYDDLGCAVDSKTSGAQNGRSVLLIPDYEGIVVKTGNVYGVIDSEGKELIKSVLNSVYAITASGETTYYMTSNNQVLNVIDYIKKYVKNSATNSDNSQTNTITNTVTNNVTNNTVETNTQQNAVTNSIANDVLDTSANVVQNSTALNNIVNNS